MESFGAGFTTVVITSEQEKALDAYIKNQKTTVDLNEFGETFDKFEERIENSIPAGWLYYSTDVSRCLHYYNFDRVTSNPTTSSKIVWTRQFCFRASDINLGNPELQKKLQEGKVKFSLDKLEMLCSETKFKLLLFSFYDQNDKIMTSANTPWIMDIPPDTNKEKLFKLVCP